MAAFRGSRYEAAVDIVEERFAQGGSGGNDGGVTVRAGHTLLEDCQLVGLEDGDRVAERLEIVQEDAAWQPASLGYGPYVNQPRHVGQPRHVLRHRTGDAEAGHLDSPGLTFCAPRNSRTIASSPS